MANTRLAKGTDPNSGNGDSVYAPSWVDRLTGWVARQPRPRWFYYLGIGVVLFSLQIAVFWSEGAYPVGVFLPAHALLATMIPLYLALLHYLDDKAGAALAVLRPALRVNEGGEYSGLRHQLTTLPARPTLLASLVGVPLVLLLNRSELVEKPSSFVALAGSPISTTLTLCIYMIVWWVVGAFIYHTVHQLRVIHLIYTRYTRVDLARMKPLYAFSALTAITAVALTASTYVWLAVNAGMLADRVALLITLPITALALVAFAWPLLGVHRLLVEEQHRRLDEVAQLFKTVTAELHRRLAEGEFEEMDDLGKALANLETERQMLRRTATWPWESETVRLLVTALALPLGLRFAEFVLQRILRS